MSTELNSGNPQNLGAAPPRSLAAGKAIFTTAGRAAALASPLMKITVGVSPALDAMIDNMAEDLEETKSMTILRALALLKAALDTKANGERLMIVNDVENSERELEF